MKLIAKADILLEGKKYKTGTVFEATEDNASLLLGYAWAEKVAEEVKAPKKATKKK